MNDYYKKTINKIKTLIDESKFDDALKIIKEEMSMPYIPKKHEDEILSCYSKILSAQKTDTNVNYELSSEQIMNSILTKDKNYIFALSRINTINLREWINEIEKAFDNNKDNLHDLSLVFEAMVDQSIDHDFKMGDKHINPKNGSILFSKNNETAFEAINSKVTNDPTLRDITMHLMHEYLVSIFPNTLDEDISDYFIFIARESLGIPNQKNDLNVDLIKKIKGILF